MNNTSLRQSSGSRRRIVDLLKRNGPMDAAALAGQLGLSSMAVRQHLYTLVEEGLACSSTSPDGVGRPSKQWRLTPAAEEFFPQGYAELTAGLLSAMSEAFGETGIEQIVQLRTRDQEKTYRSFLDGADTLETRLAKLTEIRTKEGYMAEFCADGDGYLFIENHCPICAAAKACTGLCAAELMLFRAVLGDDVEIKRTEHILAGARRCAYRISSAAGTFSKDL